MLVREAALKLGVPASQLIDWLRKRGVPVRGPSTPVKPSELRAFRKQVPIERRTKGERRVRRPEQSAADRRKARETPLLAGRRALVDGSNIAFGGGKMP